jgi:hypothetical protein
MLLLHLDEFFERFELCFKTLLIYLFKEVFDLREEIAFSCDILGSAFRVNDLEVCLFSSILMLCLFGFL